MGDRTLWYIEQYTDETMPCAPTLEAWAQWLAAPDKDWGRDTPASEGDTFKAYTFLRHDDVVAQLTPDGLVLTPEPHPGADFFAVAFAGGGWDAEASGDTPIDALGGDDAAEYHGDAPVDLAVCTQTPGYRRLRFTIGDDGPTLIDEGPEQ